MAGAPRKPGAKEGSRGAEAAKGTAKSKARRAGADAAKGAAPKRPPAGKAAPKRPPAGKAAPKKAPAGKTTPKRPPAGKAASKRPPAGRYSSRKVAPRDAALEEVDEERRAAKPARRKQSEPTPTARARAAAGVVEARGEAADRRARRKPSERLLAVFAELPAERSLTDEEREAMSKVSDAARRVVGADGSPARVVERIAAFVDDVRLGKCEEPKSQDVRLGLGVLWGEQLRAQVGWRWVHLTYPDGFASYALVPDDRAFACFPLNRLPEAFRANATNTSARVFDSIRDDTLPSRKPNAYLVIG